MRGAEVCKHGSAACLLVPIAVLGTAQCSCPPQPLIHCSVELVRHSGARLRRFSFSECEGGPHEFRGVRRSNLLVRRGMFTLLLPLASFLAA